MGPALNIGDESVARPLALEDVYFQHLKIMETGDGPVLHGLRAGYALAWKNGGFGEIYFSEVLPGKIKAWKLHEKQTQLFMVPSGLMQLVLYDARQQSKTYGKILDLRLGRPDNYGLLRIPPGICYGFRALGNKTALLCNCPDIPHDPGESRKLPLDNDLVPYDWKLE